MTYDEIKSICDFIEEMRPKKEFPEKVIINRMLLDEHVIVMGEEIMVSPSYHYRLINNFDEAIKETKQVVILDPIEPVFESPNLVEFKIEACQPPYFQFRY